MFISKVGIHGFSLLSGSNVPYGVDFGPSSRCSIYWKIFTSEMCFLVVQGKF